MASIDKRANGRWRARWREHPGGPQRSRHFDRKIDAQAFLTHIEHSKLAGTYVDPKAGQITFSAWATEWATRRRWKPATRERIERELRLHILPVFGRQPLATIRRAQIEQWAAGLDLAPSTARRIADTLSTMLAAAVEDELIPRNPAARARLPQPESAPFVPLTIDQIRTITRAAPEHLRAAVILSAGTGLRQGEAMAVTLDRIDFLRRELRVDRQLWSPAKGVPHFAPPKTRRGYRTIALSSITTDTLAVHVSTFAPGVDGLLFHTDGRPISRANLSGIMRRTTARANLKATWHDLRHHHASMLLSAGVSPALVAERLGHDLATLLRTYAHVIRADEDRVRAIIDGQLGGSAEDWLRTGEVC